MMLDLPTRCRWILDGDLNMIENRHDKTSPCGKLLPLQERSLFNDLKRQFGVKDNPCSPGSYSTHGTIFVKMVPAS
jgi:hypothetical protein